MKKIFIINAGSSTIKFKIFDQNTNELVSGVCDRIFIDGVMKLKFLNNNNEIVEIEENAMFSDHESALNYLLKKLIDLKIIEDYKDFIGIGHRVVQGGSEINKSMLIDEEVEEIIAKNIVLAPLHNEPELKVIKAIKKIITKVKNVAIFDTSFHTTIPDYNNTYALPLQWKEQYKIKRYGAHGTSFRYINEEMKKILNNQAPNLIICHLGNGASICAVKHGKSLNTSMGFTPLEGLVMGTRCGDIDASICNYMLKASNLTMNEINNIFNKESGLKGLCGASDLRDIESNYKKGNKFDLALNIYTKRIADYIVKYGNELEQIDALVFTAGVGENSSLIRKMVIDKIKIINYALDEKINDAKFKKAVLISSEKSLPIYVVPTNEELIMAYDVLKIVK